MELRHSEVGWSNRGTIADTAIFLFFFILIGGAMKLGRGRRDERARSIALVTFGFGSAENVLLRSLRSSAAPPLRARPSDATWGRLPSSFVYRVRLSSCCSLLCANTGNCSLSLMLANPLRSSSSSGERNHINHSPCVRGPSAVRPLSLSPVCLDNHMLHHLRCARG